VRLLIVAATSLEIAPLVAALGPAHPSGPRLRRVARAGHDIDILETGIGMVSTAAWCSRVLTGTRYDVALEFGVCGSFDPALPPGSVVHVVSECLPELGAEDGDGLLTLDDLGLLGEDAAFFEAGWLHNRRPPANTVLDTLPVARGITVNSVHGRLSTMYSCVSQGVPFAEVRAVSNVVEPRNRDAWKMKEAIANLCVVAGQMIGAL
jgi:futalosine hydrolase